MNEIAPGQAHDRTEGQVLIDVREPDEWAAGHAPSAIHIPLTSLADAKLPDAEEYLLVCRAGGRSAKATEALITAGLHATNVAGGMNAWAAAGLPVVTDTGESGTVA